MLIDNILFLRERFPVIRQYFAQHETDLQLQQLECMASKAGYKTIRYHVDKNQPLMVHSIYNPIREAERVIASHKDGIKDDTHIFFYGIGMGYHVEKFIEQYPNNSYSLYEPIPEVFFEMSKHRDINRIIAKNIRHLYVDQHNKETLAYLEEFQTNNRKIHLIVLPSYKNIIKEKYERFHNNIKEMILNRRINLQTDAGFQKFWVMNSIINFKTVLNTPNMLKDIDRTQFEGKPAIIVSAGPSLAEDIEYIRYIKANNLAYIFSVGSAINSLIEYDVLPDAVFTYDPKRRNKNVFKKMIENGIDHIPMVFGSSVGYETIKDYQGPKVHFITSQDKTSLYLLEEQLEFEEHLIVDSPSIAVMAFQVLTKLGTDPIIFAGQNLGYLNGRQYSKGIAYDHIPTNIDKETLDKALITTDVYGNEMKTNHSFNSMRKAIEKIAKLYTKRTFINTTKGGARIEGVPFQTIETLIRETLKQSNNTLKWWKAKNSYNEREVRIKYQLLKKSMKDFINIISQLDKVINNISLSTKVRNKTQLISELQKFDSIYNSLGNNVYYKFFVSFYIRTHVKYVANEIIRLNLEDDIFIKGKEIIELITMFISHCKQANIEINEFLDKGMEHLK
ncbi:MAG TPA: 6-hydroxymethylpterin diphosphokinase MptE-like protein [Cerasibacillus sp.]|uniref:motility associated factor glycosyltransferase family protein n=1 Tax=Cerasibacillus sp. TaxID=2498711 RepID=UPI002F422F4A